MRELDRHIHALLLDHDCVIVPELGGFIASRQSARIDSGRQIGVPPKRNIAFNIYLRQNDGLLAKRLVDTEQVTYPAALQEIEAYVAQCMLRLDGGEKVTIRKVGTLSFDAAKSIQFDPDDTSPLCPDAFGLTALPVHIIDSDTIASPPVRPVAAGKSRKTKKAPQRQRSLVGLMAILGAILWFSLNVYLVSRDRYSMAGMNPLDSVFPDETTGQTVIPPPAPVIRVETVYVPSVAPETTSMAAEKPSEPVATAPVIPPVTAPSPELRSPTDSFFVIAGVFAVRENADRLVNSMIGQGFGDAAIIKQTATRFYVGVAGFGSEAEAVTFRKRLSERNIEGWVYRR